MSTPEFDSQQELLRSIATSLKAIHSSLENLTGAVEGVAESIDKAHEPEGDLGVHLVSALKDLSSSLHKRAQQERSPQPSLRLSTPQHSQQNRRDDRPQRIDNRLRQERASQEQPPFGSDSSESQEDFVAPEFPGVSTPLEAQANSTSNDPQESGAFPSNQHSNARPRPRPKERAQGNPGNPRSNRRGGGQGKPPAAESPTTPAFIPPSAG